MDATNLTLEIGRRDVGATRLVEQTLAPLAPGQVRLRVERYAVTANTVTYAATGDLLGYWGFFPGRDPDWGRVPAMGWAEVVASSQPEILPGSRHYGWFPMSRYVDVTASPAPEGFRDDGAHRAPHAPVYRSFVRTDRDPYYQPGADAEDRHALLRGLFITGFLADDFLDEQAWFGASRVVVLSASSKTAIAFAHCADARAGIEVIGVTSAANHAFTHALGCYDEVVAYEEIGSVPPGAPIVSVDMSGNGRVLERVHAHFGGQLRHSMAIGLSHRDAPPRSEGMPGPRPAFFFAPTQVKKRLQDWGTQGYQARTAQSLHRFVDSSRSWLELQRSPGPVAATAAWREACAGTIAPRVGRIASLWDQ